MIAIGLTGGIGTGKSTVSEYLKKKKFYIIDADKMSHEITQPGSPVLKKIRDIFGDKVFLCEDVLNRKKLADIVFKDDDKLMQLQSVTTDFIAAEILKKLEMLRAENKEKVVFVDAPLLFECGLDEYMDLTWLIYADMDVRINRVAMRDNASKEEISARISNQLSDEEKKCKADFLIDNSGSVMELYKQIDKLIERIEDEKN